MLLSDFGNYIITDVTLLVLKKIPFLMFVLGSVQYAQDFTTKVKSDSRFFFTVFTFLPISFQLFLVSKVRKQTEDLLQTYTLKGSFHSLCCVYRLCSHVSTRIFQQS